MASWECIVCGAYSHHPTLPPTWSEDPVKCGGGCQGPEDSSKKTVQMWVRLLHKLEGDLEETIKVKEARIGQIRDKLRLWTGCDCASLGISCEGHDAEMDTGEHEEMMRQMRKFTPPE